MKKCPTCEKTFEDSMRFCQIDGTPLLDDAPAFDPYATMVATAAPVVEAEPEVASASSTAIDVPDDVLEVPADPLKTMYVSDAEMKEVLGGDAPVEEIKADAAETAPEPEPPAFTVPDVPAPTFGDVAPPPSPFSAPASADDGPVPAPAMFDEPKAEPQEAETLLQPQAPSPFDMPPPAAPMAEWTPPPAPDATWQNQEIGANTPFQPPPAGAAAGGQNKTLAIISMVAGIVGLLCCSNLFVVGLAAIVMGFIANGKASSDPNAYGGKGMAWAGIILGFVSLMFGAIYWILIATGAIAFPNF